MRLSHFAVTMHFRQALPIDAAVVADVLSAAASALAERGEPLWGARDVGIDAVASHVERGMYHLGFDAEGVVGVFRFQLDDPFFWPEIPPGSSAFVHKLAVLPARQGRGAAHLLLAHACDLTRQHGRGWLRLDCVVGRPRLRAVYEGFGFRHHSVKDLGGDVVDRFELEVGRA